MIGALLLVVSAVLLVIGAEMFVENAAGAAQRMGVTVLAVGLLLAGAEPEELLTAVLASARHHPDLAAGDAIGANVTMLTAALGLAAVVRPLPFGPRVRSYAVMSAVAGLLSLATLADGQVSRAEGGALVAAYVVLVAVIWRRERQPPVLGELAELAETADDGDAEERPPSVALLLAIIGIAVIVVGGALAVDGAERVVRALGQTDSAIGLTLLALATTAELFALVYAAARRGATEIAVAGIVGSAAYNATATLGAAALTRPLAVSGILGSAIIASILPVALVVFAARGRLGRPAGALLCLAYAGFVVFVFSG